MTNIGGSAKGGNGGTSSTGSATGGHSKRGGGYGGYPFFFPGVGGSATSGNSGNVNGGDVVNNASPWGYIYNGWGSGKFQFILPRESGCLTQTFQPLVVTAAQPQPGLLLEETVAGSALAELL